MPRIGDRGKPPRRRAAAPGEDQLLGWLRQRFDLPEVGDDAAVLPASPALAVTVDSQVAGIHFLADLDPACVARRLLAVNLSDLAAMGATPKFAFLALTAPPGFNHRRFFRALLAACLRFRLRLAGGDLSRSPGSGWVATLTLLGSKPSGGRWLHRSGALPGQDLWLGGTVGESAAGGILVGAGARLEGRRVSLAGHTSTNPRGRQLDAAARRAVRRHLLPQPQLELGSWLARQSAGAAMDVSDGLARDLPRLCRESRVGAHLELERLPFASGFAALCHELGVAPLDLAIGGGEDYVLLFTLPRGVEPPARFGSHRVGTITAGKRVAIIAQQHGKRVLRDLPRGGWDHLAPD